MEKLNFLPLWEIERIAKKNKRNFYVLLFIFIFCSLLLFILLVFNMNNIQKLKMENTFRKSLNNEKYGDKKVENQKKVDSLKSYQWFNKEISKVIILKEMIVKNKEIIISAKVKDYNDYFSLVSYMEDKCKVKDVSIAKFDADYLEFSVTLEANYE